MAPTASASGSSKASQAADKAVEKGAQGKSQDGAQEAQEGAQGGSGTPMTEDSTVAAPEGSAKRKAVKATSKKLEHGQAVAYGNGLALVAGTHGEGEVDLIILEPGEAVRGVTGVHVYDNAADAEEASHPEQEQPRERNRVAHLHG
jgi:hypothetical protein